MTEFSVKNSKKAVEFKCLQCYLNTLKKRQMSTKNAKIAVFSWRKVSTRFMKQKASETSVNNSKNKKNTKKSSMKRSGASCGLSFTCPAEIFSALQVTTDSGYDFLVTPIVHPRFRARSDMKRNYAFTRSDLILSSSEWSSLVVGAVSRHLSLESPNAGVRRDAEDALQRELNFASHLGKKFE